MQNDLMIADHSFFNNTLCLSPALICTKDDLDLIVSSMDTAITQVTAG